MKAIKISLLGIAFLGFSLGANAQITLEHTFDGSVSHNFTHVTPTIDHYVYFNTTTNQVKLYNEDYSLYKSVTITPPANYSFNTVSTYSKNIITTDGKVTFFVTFINNNTTDDLRSNFKLYDEDGTIVKDFGYEYMFIIYGIHAISDNKLRLSILRYTSTNPLTYQTDIYSLPGTVTSIAPPTEGNNTFQSPYPNPANTVITLPYKLEQGEMSVMSIYSINGQLIETKQIDYVFDKILLNVSGYAKGMYIYEVNGVSSRFVVK